MAFHFEMHLSVLFAHGGDPLALSVVAGGRCVAEPDEAGLVVEDADLDDGGETERFEAGEIGKKEPEAETVSDSGRSLLLLELGAAHHDRGRVKAIPQEHFTQPRKGLGRGGSEFAVMVIDEARRFDRTGIERDREIGSRTGETAFPRRDESGQQTRPDEIERPVDGEHLRDVEPGPPVMVCQGEACPEGESAEERQGERTGAARTDAGPPDKKAERKKNRPDRFGEAGDHRLRAQGKAEGRGRSRHQIDPDRRVVPAPHRRRGPSPGRHHCRQRSESDRKMHRRQRRERIGESCKGAVIA